MFLTANIVDITPLMKLRGIMLAKITKMEYTVRFQFYNIPNLNRLK